MRRGLAALATAAGALYKYNFEQLNEGISYRSGADPGLHLATQMATSR